MLIPKQLKQLKFCRIKKGNKAPFEKDWNNKPYSYEKITLTFPMENYGVLCGYESLAVIDCDNPQLVTMIKNMLPETFSVRTGGGGTHFYYFIPELKKKIILNLDNTHLGEVQSHGTQVVGAGSIHPNGKEYEVLDNVGIKELSLEELKKVIGGYMEKEETKSEEKEVGEKTKEIASNVNFEKLLVGYGLEKKGENWNCPFHKSEGGQCLSVDKKKGIFNCFHCGWSGNIISFVSKVEDITIKEALDKLKPEEGKSKKKVKKNYISSYVDNENKILVEQIYEKGKRSLLCIYDHNTKEIKFTKEWKYNSKIFVPQEGEELEKGAILLPSRPEEYIEEELNQRIGKFVYKWLDVPEDVVRFGIWNTKRSWVYDVFHTLNYLRALGDTGMGKSRYLNTLGCIHYKPIFTSGATTTAPLFRIIDKWRGTLVMDEADLKYSDESADTIKIINQGFEKNSFIMRCDQNDATKIKFFDPYCPKILATRRPFEDKATESRCITHVMEVTERKDIPVNLNAEFYKEAQEIRNQLLMWRFKNYFEIDLDKKFYLGDLEPRVRQIVSSYIALFSNDEIQMEDFKNYIQNYQEDLIEERQTSFEGSIVGAIHSLLRNLEKDFDAKRIIEKGEFTGRNGKPMQPRALNSYLKSLGFKKSNVIKVDGKSKRCVPIEPKHINKLFERYGYEVTEVTVVMETPEFKKREEREEKQSKVTVGGGLPNNRNNRNSVTNKTPNNYKNFGEVDFKDHQIEQAEEQYEKDRKEIEDD